MEISSVRLPEQTDKPADTKKKEPERRAAPPQPMRSPFFFLAPHSARLPPLAVFAKKRYNEGVQGRRLPTCSKSRQTFTPSAA